eukprot:12895446-Prorocentrum_lima.AAC.1
MSCHIDGVHAGETVIHGIESRNEVREGPCSWISLPNLTYNWLTPCARRMAQAPTELGCIILKTNGLFGGFAKLAHSG